MPEFTHSNCILKMGSDERQIAQLKSALANLLEVTRHIHRDDWRCHEVTSGIYHSREVAEKAISPIPICVSKCKICLPNCPFNPIN